MTYKCAMCGREFESGWSEEEALAELTRTFGAIKPDECEVLCNVCYRKIDPAKYPRQVEEAVAEHLRRRL